MSKSISELFNTDKKLVSIYFTAGFPQLHDTVGIIENLEKSGVDLIEIGLPFSDPLADGPTIQESSTKALRNGMTTELLFEQLSDIRQRVNIPLIIMGYFNPVMQYGVEAFCQKCEDIGIDALILPDLPLREYQLHYKEIFNRHGLDLIYLITPQTPEERIRAIDEMSNSFIYMVSSSSTTGAKAGFSEENQGYFKRIADMKLKNPTLVGFGISDKNSFDQATAHSQGAIIGSAFIKHIESQGIDQILSFVQNLKA
ncbi:MAG: tryptophan synthase subunit alpha [Flavobacteriaceae bacterium]|nr:tryptophan synthase subunit alpha [Flavobacteriaceae bacterium]